MRHALGWMVVGMLFGTAITGCGPEVSQSELGTIVYEVPAVAGADEPYRLPELPPSATESLQDRLKMAPPDSAKPAPLSDPAK